MTQIFTVAANAVYYGLDCAGKAAKDFDAASSVCKLANLSIKCVNQDLKGAERLFQPLADTLKVITDTSPIRGWVGKLITLVSGKAAGIDDLGANVDADRIWITPDVSIPNVLKIISVSCQLTGDILGSFKWLDNLELINLAKLTSDVGMLPFFGKLVADMTLQSTLGTLNVFGIIFDLADTTRDIYQNGLTFYNGTQVVADIAKLVGIVVATSTGNFFILAVIADGTATICSFSRFVMKSYGIGMTP